ncbi:hypothetical protein N2152v2_001973 [Parachlorella kessleri]
MSKSVFQPIGQKRLTNIAVVRYKSHGKRFEIACYKNKVLNWRNGIERDLDEVLQSTTIFSNVSKGVLAKREDLLQVFGTDDEEKICLKILSEGELQVSDKERKVELDTLFRDVASIVSEKCINPETRRPYTITMIERALRDAHFNVDPKRPAKAQALEALPLLQQRFPIERARMRLRITVPLGSREELLSMLQGKQGGVVEEQDLVGSSQLVVVCLVEPGLFRDLHSLVQSSSEGVGRLDVVALAATGAGAEGEVGALAGGVEALGLGAQQAQQGGVRQQGGGEVARAAASSATTSSGFVAATAGSNAVPPRRRATGATGAADAAGAAVLYPRGPISGLPEEHASRKERFAELDDLQPGWTVELRSRGEGAPVDAVFFSPGGDQALGSMQLGSSAFQGKQLQLRPVQVAQPFRPAVVPIRAAKTLSGKVISTDMQKTAVVAVESYSVHPRYKKRSRQYKKYKVHDEEEKCQVGDLVSIAPSRPISKSKTFVVTGIERRQQ